MDGSENQSADPPAAVWRLTSARFKSVDDKSILAAIEAAVAVIAYWMIAWAFDTHAHLLLSILVAPLLLMRSLGSVELGAKWFENLAAAKEDSTSIWRTIVLTGVISMVSYVVYCALIWLGRDHELRAAWLAALAGFLALTPFAFAIPVSLLFSLKTYNGGIIGVLASAALGVALYSSIGKIEWMPFILCLAIPALLLAFLVTFSEKFSPKRSGVRLMQFARSSLLFMAMLGSLPLWTLIFGAVWGTAAGIRFAATICNFRSGVRCIAANYSETVLRTDLLSPVELVPGHSHYSSRWFADEFTKRTGEERIVRGVSWLVVVLAAALYRFSIKSTCWMYWPLAYVTRTPHLSNDPELFFNGVTSDPWAKLQRRFAWITVSLILFISFGGWLLKLLSASQPQSGGIVHGVNAVRERLGELPKLVSPFEYLFLIDFRELTLWTWLTLAAAIITIGAWYYASRLALNYDYWGKKEDRANLEVVKRRAVALQHALSIRVPLVTAITLIWMVHAVLTFTPATACLPTEAISKLEAFYGKWMPDVHAGPCPLQAWVTRLPKLPTF